VAATYANPSPSLLTINCIGAGLEYCSRKSLGYVTRQRAKMIGEAKTEDRMWFVWFEFEKSERSHICHNYMSRLNTITSDSISPGTTSTTAIPAIYVKDGTFNSAGRDQTNITYVYNVDPNCNQGIWEQSSCDSNSSVVQTKSISGCPL
jgi:hypothetical protein